MQIAINAGQQVRLSSRRRSRTRLANVAQSILAVSRAGERCAQRVKVARRVFIFRLYRLLQFADSLLVFSLIHQYPAKIEVRLAVAGFVVNGLLIFGCRLGEQALPFEEIPEVV